MDKYVFSMYPVKKPIIEMGLIDRNKFLNNCYCITISCNTLTVLKYEFMKFLNRNDYASYYGFYVYNHKNATNYFYSNTINLIEAIDRGDI